MNKLKCFKKINSKVYAKNKNGAYDEKKQRNLRKISIKEK